MAASSSPSAPAAQARVISVAHRFVVFLQGEYIHLVLLAGGNTAGNGGEGGDAGDTVLPGSGAAGARVEEGSLAERRVQDKIDFAALNHVHEVRPPFVHLVNRFHRNAALLQSRSRPACRNEFEAKLLQSRSAMRMTFFL